jgi:uncharacterized protein YllA (UPF0747 family)
LFTYPLTRRTYHAQVKIRPINLFYNYAEGRYVIEPVENEFRLKGKRKKFSPDELNDIIEAEPEKFNQINIKTNLPRFLFQPGLCWWSSE